MHIRTLLEGHAPRGAQPLRVHIRVCVYMCTCMRVRVCVHRLTLCGVGCCVHVLWHAMYVWYMHICGVLGCACTCVYVCRGW